METVSDLLMTDATSSSVSPSSQGRHERLWNEALAHLRCRCEEKKEAAAAAAVRAQAQA